MKRRALLPIALLLPPRSPLAPSGRVDARLVNRPPTGIAELHSGRACDLVADLLESTLSPRTLHDVQVGTLSLAVLVQIHDAIPQVADLALRQPSQAELGTQSSGQVLGEHLVDSSDPLLAVLQKRQRHARQEDLNCQATLTALRGRSELTLDGVADVGAADQSQSQPELA